MVFYNLAISLGKGLDGKTDLAIKCGAFINACSSFAILAFCVFMLVKAVNGVKQRFEAEKTTEPAKPSTTDTLLEEIRDELKKQAWSGIVRPHGCRKPLFAAMSLNDGIVMRQ